MGPSGGTFGYAALVTSKTLQSDAYKFHSIPAYSTPVYISKTYPPTPQKRAPRPHATAPKPPKQMLRPHTVLTHLHLRILRRLRRLQREVVLSTKQPGRARKGSGERLGFSPSTLVRIRAPVSRG